MHNKLYLRAIKVSYVPFKTHMDHFTFLFFNAFVIVTIIPLIVYYYHFFYMHHSVYNIWEMSSQIKEVTKICCSVCSCSGLSPHQTERDNFLLLFICCMCCKQRAAPMLTGERFTVSTCLLQLIWSRMLQSQHVCCSLPFLWLDFFEKNSRWLDSIPGKLIAWFYKKKKKSVGSTGTLYMH